MRYNYKHIVVMNIQIFPHKFKYFFFIVVIISTIISGGDDFVDGFWEGYNDGRNNNAYNYHETPEAEQSHYFKDIFGGNKNLRIFTIISILGLLGYVMTKERVEDDYIKFLRLSSYQLAFFIIILISLVLFLFNTTYKYGMEDTLVLFLILYLVIFAIKKRIA